MDRETIRDVMQEMEAPDEAMEAYPDECANCGASPSPVFVPNDYHEQGDGRDPGICTECGHHFGTGNQPSG